MPEVHPRYDVVVRRGLGSLPIGLRYVGLVRSEGVETVRIRFSLDRDKLLDLPLSAEVLAQLAQFLGNLHGKLPEQMSDEIEYLRQMGGIQES